MKLTPYNEAVTSVVSATTRVTEALTANVAAKEALNKALDDEYETSQERWECVLEAMSTYQAARKEVYSALEWYGEVSFVVQKQWTKLQG
jgi:hypothetical protein